MLNKLEIDQFYELVDSLGLKFPVAAISSQTKFSKGQVSDYLKRKKEPSQNFLNAFYEKFGKGSVNVPRGLSGGGKNPQGDPTNQLLADLVHTNRNLSESNKSLAVSHEELVGMVKKDSRPDEAQYTMKETVALVKVLKETMIEIVADVKGVSKVEASQVLHNKVMAAMEKVGKKDSRPVVSK